MKLFYLISIVYASSLESRLEGRKDANSFLARRKRGLMKGLAAGAGFAVGAKAVNSVMGGFENDEDDENDQRVPMQRVPMLLPQQPIPQRPSIYDQNQDQGGIVCREEIQECLSEREEVREEPEEEREGPWNLFGWFRG